MSKPTPAKKPKTATPLESISPPLSEAISDASSILKNFSSASHQKDECDHYGSLIACQLRGLSPQQRAIVMMEFNQIMFRARFGQYEEEGLNFANLS